MNIISEEDRRNKLRSFYNKKALTAENCESLIVIGISSYKAVCKQCPL